MKCLGFVFLWIAFYLPSLAHSGTFEETALGLAQGSYSEKAEIIEALADIDDPRVLDTLVAMLDAKLYYQEAEKRLIIIEEHSDKTFAIDVNSGRELGEIDTDSADKIRINNRLRGALRPEIALLRLRHKNRDIRLASARDLTKDPDAGMRPIIAQAREQETERKVKEALSLALAMIDIQSDDQRSRLDALDVLASTVEPEAVGILKRLSARGESGDYLEADARVAKEAETKLAIVESRVALYDFFENIIFGFSLGSILLLAAIGLAITFGVMGVINMAHGEMIMLGAYTTYAIQQLFPSMMDWSLLMAIPAAFLVSACAGILIERLVIRHLYGRALDTLLATFGISLILQQAVRMYSSNNVAVVTPDWLAGFWAVNGAMSLTYNRIYILIFSLIVLLLLALLLKKTLVGLQIRAVTQNRAMANSMGIRSSWVDAMTFGLGSGIAGIAGVALSQITNVGPNLGQGYIIDSFMVVVFGGVGNLLGTFFGAMTLGVANKLLEPVTGAVVGKIIVLVFIILFIQWRPRGLFALKGRFVED